MNTSTRCEIHLPCGASHNRGEILSPCGASHYEVKIAALTLIERKSTDIYVSDV